jgi:hypothetical protein
MLQVCGMTCSLPSLHALSYAHSVVLLAGTALCQLHALQCVRSGCSEGFNPWTSGETMHHNALRLISLNHSACAGQPVYHVLDRSFLEGVHCEGAGVKLGGSCSAGSRVKGVGRSAAGAVRHKVRREGCYAQGRRKQTNTRLTVPDPA